MTNNQEQQTDELKKKIKKIENERDELAIMAYMAGNVGDVYLMDAVAEEVLE